MLILNPSQGPNSLKAKITVWLQIKMSQFSKRCSNSGPRLPQTDEHYFFAAFSLFILTSAISKCSDSGIVRRECVPEGNCQKQQMKDEISRLRAKSRNPRLSPVPFYFCDSHFLPLADWNEMMSLFTEGAVTHPCLLSLSITLVFWMERYWLNAGFNFAWILSNELDYCHVMTGLLRSSVSLFSEIHEKFPQL